MIISVPTIFSCKTPKSGWLNLALIRQLQYDQSTEPPDPPLDMVLVVWNNGERQAFTGDDATAILNAWQDATQRCTCQNSRHEEYEDSEVYD